MGALLLTLNAAAAGWYLAAGDLHHAAFPAAHVMVLAAWAAVGEDYINDMSPYLYE